jgi:hypothetical protein
MGDSPPVPSLGELQSDAIQAQLFALSAFSLHCSVSDDFAIESATAISSGLKVLLCRRPDSDCVVVPLFHDFPVPSLILPELLDAFPDHRKFLGLCAPDATIIFHEISDFEF